MVFKDFTFDDFWYDCDYSVKEYIGSQPDDKQILEVEQILGYKLSESYIWLMKQHNGGMTNKTFHKTKTSTSWSEDGIAITGILGIGSEKRNSLCGEFGSKFWIEEWEYPDIGVAICDCPSAGHDMIFLDYSLCGKNGEPRVVHVDQEADFEITIVADNFECFIRGLECDEI